MSLPSQSVLTDLFALAVGKTALRQLVSVDDFRAWYASNHDKVTAGDRLRLQPVWDDLAVRPGFDAKVAACPMCWLKTLEPRLGAAVELPAALATMKSSEVATQAAKFFVNRDDIDRLLGEAPAPAARQTTPLPGSLKTSPRSSGAADPGAASLGFEPGAAPVSFEPGAPPALLDPVHEPDPPAQRASTPRPANRKAMSPERRRLITVVSAVIALGSIVFVAGTLRQGCSKPPTAMTAPPGLPVEVGQRLGRDVRFVLRDETWLKLPVEQRSEQLKQALEVLRADNVESFIVVDAQGKPLATAQWTQAQAVVRFY